MLACHLITTITGAFLSSMLWLAYSVLQRLIKRLTEWFVRLEELSSMTLNGASPIPSTDCDWQLALPQMKQRLKSLGYVVRVLRLSLNWNIVRDVRNVWISGWCNIVFFTRIRTCVDGSLWSLGLVCESVYDNMINKTLAKCFSLRVKFCCV